MRGDTAAGAAPGPSGGLWAGTGAAPSPTSTSSPSWLHRGGEEAAGERHRRYATLARELRETAAAMREHLAGALGLLEAESERMLKALADTEALQAECQQKALEAQASADQFFDQLVQQVEVKRQEVKARLGEQSTPKQWALREQAASYAEAMDRMEKAAGEIRRVQSYEGELAFLENAGPVELEAEQALALPALQALARKPAVTSDYRLEGRSINPFSPGTVSGARVPAAGARRAPKADWTRSDGAMQTLKAVPEFLAPTIMDWSSGGPSRPAPAALPGSTPSSLDRRRGPPEQVQQALVGAYQAARSNGGPSPASLLPRQASPEARRGRKPAPTTASMPWV